MVNPTGMRQHRLPLGGLVLASVLIAGATAAGTDSRAEVALFRSGGEFAGWERQRFSVAKADLNTPISPHNLYMFVSTSGDSRQRSLNLIVTVGRPSTRHSKSRERVPGCIRPDSVYWQVREGKSNVLRQWEPHFANRLRSPPGDDYYTTRFALPERDLKRSHLLLYFRGFDGDSRDDGIVIDLDMGQYDWSTTSRHIFRPIIQ